MKYWGRIQGKQPHYEKTLTKALTKRNLGFLRRFWGGFGCFFGIPKLGYFKYKLDEPKYQVWAKLNWFEILRFLKVLMSSPPSPTRVGVGITSPSNTQLVMPFHQVDHEGTNLVRSFQLPNELAIFILVPGRCFYQSYFWPNDSGLYHPPSEVRHPSCRSTLDGAFYCRLRRLPLQNEPSNWFYDGLG